MYKIICSKCDFNAKSTLNVLSNKKCPCCGGDLSSKPINPENVLKDLEIEDTLNKYKPLNEEFILMIDNAALCFKEISLEDDEDSAIHSVKRITRYTKNGMKYEEKYVDEAAYKISVLAKSLIMDEVPYNKKLDFLKKNFSKKQLDLLFILYDTEIRDKYEPIMQDQLQRYLDSSEAQLEELAEVLEEELASLSKEKESKDKKEE